MLERDSVTAYLPGWPRSAAMRAALATKKSGRPVEIGLVEQHEPGFLVREHVLAECAASVASRSAIAASRALASGEAAAPARVKSR